MLPRRVWAVWLTPGAIRHSSMLERLLTVCIKYTPGFASRHRKLRALLASIRRHHGSMLSILVASEGELGAALHQLHSEGMVSKFVSVPPGAGLSLGRNALLQEARTPFVAIMDDDLLLPGNQSLPTLLDALLHSTHAAVAGGCHHDLKRGVRDCFNMRFETSEGGSIVRMGRVQAPSGSCSLVHATHNFFIGRTEVLQRFRWDDRQRVMEHETFFYQLYLNGIGVLACPDAVVWHNTRANPDDAYERHSLRATEGLHGRDPGNQFMQYLCKNLPQVRRFETPFTTWRCDVHEFCTPLWDAQFAHDGRHCAPFAWDASDDTSQVARPLGSVGGVRPDVDAIARAGAGGAHLIARSPPPAHVPLLALVLTEPSHVEHRAWQRATWLSFQWHARSERDVNGHAVAGDGDALVPWRYVYIATAVDAEVVTRHAQAKDPRADGRAAGEVLGDTVVLPASQQGTGRRSLSVSALRWAISHIRFEVVLLTDDHGLVHVGRVWEWLLARTRESNFRVATGRFATQQTATSLMGHAGLNGGSLLMGLHVCQQLVRRRAFAHNRSSLRGIDTVAATGFRRVSKGKLSSAAVGAVGDTFRGAMVVDGVLPRPSERPLAAFRALMQADGHPAVWQKPNAFSRESCSGCEARFFPREHSS